jgi:hypothetical protein
MIPNIEKSDQNIRSEGVMEWGYFQDHIIIPDLRLPKVVSLTDAWDRDWCLYLSEDELMCQYYPRWGRAIPCINKDNELKPQSDWALPFRGRVVQWDDLRRHIDP